MPSTSDLRLILAAGAILALAAFVVQWEESGRLNADLTLERARADSLFRAYRDARAQVDGTTIMAQQRERQLQRLLAAAGARRVRREVPPPNAPPETVRVVAAEAIAEIDTLHAVIDTLSLLTDSLSSELRIERWRTDQALDAADSTIAAQRTLITALNAPPAPCRVLGVPCPTRTQSAAVGALLALVLVVAR